MTTSNKAEEVRESCDGTKVKWIGTNEPFREWIPTKEPCPDCKGTGLTLPKPKSGEAKTYDLSSNVVSAAAHAITDAQISELQKKCPNLNLVRSEPPQAEQGGKTLGQINFEAPYAKRGWLAGELQGWWDRLSLENREGHEERAQAVALAATRAKDEEIAKQYEVIEKLKKALEEALRVETLNYVLPPTWWQQAKEALQHAEKAGVR